MQENIYQNIDLVNNNPLKPETKTELTFREKLKTDHKVQTLVGLSVFTVLILVLSLVVSILRPPTTREDIGTNLPTPMATPTYINEANVLPTQYQDQFNTIINKIKYNPEILPPQIDVNLGN
ncbi:MAG: hypothetical protein WC069_01425 [Candidatus Shapirobacteria bacterium]